MFIHSTSTTTYLLSTSTRWPLLPQIWLRRPVTIHGISLATFFVIKHKGHGNASSIGPLWVVTVFSEACGPGKQLPEVILGIPYLRSPLGAVVIPRHEPLFPDLILVTCGGYYRWSSVTDHTTHASFNKTVLYFPRNGVYTARLAYTTLSICWYRFDSSEHQIWLELTAAPSSAGLVSASAEMGPTKAANCD